MKKTVLILLTLSILTTSLFFVGCHRDKDPFRPVISGDFIYSRVGVIGENNVAIIGLSPQGKTKETIVFPTMIDGYRVTDIGAKYINKPNEPIVFDYAKNIYYTGQHNYICVGTGIEYNYSKDCNNLNIFVGSRFPNIELYSSNANKIFINKDCFDKELELGYDKWFNFYTANTTYYLDEDENIYEHGLFFIDDVDGSKVNVIPPTPYKEDYEFVGWYKDVARTTLWDFDNDIIPAKKYDEDGNYMFQETRIYAKWNKIN